MRLILNGDLIVATVSGDVLAGVPVPPELDGTPHERLIVVGDDIVDAATLSRFYIDTDGRKFGATAAGRQQLDCPWDAAIEPDGTGGWRIVDQLARFKEQRKAAIDAEAERQRLRWITPGAGQAMEYQQSATEAAAYFAAGHSEPPAAGTYPMLEASVGIDGETLADVASTVLAMHGQWQVIGSAIRGARLAAKQAIDIAATVAEAEAVRAIWPNPEM